MPPIRDSAYSLCAWRRVALRLNSSQQAWIRYCYGLDLNFDFQQEICSYIWTLFEESIAGLKLQKRVKMRLISIAWLAVQDRASTNRNDSYKEIAGAFWPDT